MKEEILKNLENPRKLEALVLGANSLILANLVFVTFWLFKMLKNRNEADRVERSIGSFLPIYIGWIMIVTFIFPIVFNFN